VKSRCDKTGSVPESLSPAGPDFQAQPVDPPPPAPSSGLSGRIDGTGDQIDHFQSQLLEIEIGAAGTGNQNQIPVCRSQGAFNPKDFAQPPLETISNDCVTDLATDSESQTTLVTTRFMDHRTEVPGTPANAFGKDFLKIRLAADS